MIWEYKSIFLSTIRHVQLQDWLNTYGKESWELVFILDKKGGDYHQLIFKRPISNTEVGLLPEYKDLDREMSLVAESLR